MIKKFSSVAIFAIMLGFCTNNFAISSEPNNFKVAVVDVQKIVSSSKQVNDLKNNQNAKMNEMKNFIAKAQVDINAQKDEKKKESLIKKYDNDLAYMKNTNDKRYAQKLSEIEKSITKTIQDESKKAGYDLVLAKGLVLFGGTDITNKIEKFVK